MFQSVVKTIKYLFLNLQLEIKALLEYKTSFIVGSIVVPLWTLLNVAFIESVFALTPTFAGYTKYEGYVLIGTFKIVENLSYFIAWKRLQMLPELVRGKGTDASFDHILLKPMDAQITATLGRYGLPTLTSILLGVFIVIYGWINLKFSFEILTLLTYIMCIGMGVTFFYVLLLSLKSLVFWTEHVEATGNLMESIKEYAQYPSGIFTGGLGVFLNGVLPVTLMAAIPSELLLGKRTLQEFFMFALIMLVLFIASRWIWKFSLKRYSGSGS